MANGFSVTPTDARKLSADASGLLSVQVMRGVAALMVVVFHILTQFSSLIGPIVLEVGRVLQAGVDVFFVISGFIMWHICSLKKLTPGKFIMSRLIRILPLYWLVTTVIAVLGFAKPTLLNNEPMDGMHLLGSYMFLPIPRQSNGQLWPLVMQGWTLNYEMLFYAIFAIAILFRPKISLLFVAASFALIHGLTWVLPTTAQHSFYGNSILFEFLLGIGLAYVYNMGVRLPRVAGFSLLAVGVLLLMLTALLPDVLRFFKWGIPALMIVAGLVLQQPLPKSRSITVMAAIGDASYSIYLLHFMLVHFANGVFFRLSGMFDSAVGTALVFVTTFMFFLLLSILVGYAMFLAFERPVTWYLRRLFFAQPQVANEKLVVT